MAFPGGMECSGRVLLVLHSAMGMGYTGQVRPAPG